MALLDKLRRIKGTRMWKRVVPNTMAIACGIREACVPYKM